MNNEIRELSMDELDAVSGGNWLGDIARMVGKILSDHGDARRPTTSEPVKQG